MKINNEFKIGSSISSWQYEGEFDDLKENYMERIYRLDKENWFEGYGPQHGCDFFNKMEEDVELYKKLGLQSLRFTLDWTRFIDDYDNATVNKVYSEFYMRFVDLLLENEIEPIIILEHWDLPGVLYEKYDGYSSQYVVDLYVKYAEQAFEFFNGKIKKWLTFNEPIVIPELCFSQAFWYPYDVNLKKAILWMHNKNVASARAIKKFRELNIEGIIGIGGLNVEIVKVKDETNLEDVKAGEIAKYFFEKKFLMPAVKGYYDYEYLNWLKKEGLEFYCDEEQLKDIMENTVDFVGINYYHPRRIQSPLPEDRTGYGKYFSDYHDSNVEMNVDRGWEISPETLYDLAIKLRDEYDNIPWYVNENGFGCVEKEKSRNKNGMLIDDYRIDFINRHLYYAVKAHREGCNCFGYHTWSVMDNLSPFNAFKNRYGYFEVELENNFKRRPKKSAFYIQEMILNRDIELCVDKSKYEKDEYEL